MAWFENSIIGKLFFVKLYGSCNEHLYVNFQKRCAPLHNTEYWQFLWIVILKY